MLSSKYHQGQIELEEQITSLEEELEKMEQEMLGIQKWIDLIKENPVPKKLMEILLNTMMKKILIYVLEINGTGEKTQEIEIYYRFISTVSHNSVQAATESEVKDWNSKTQFDAKI